MIFCYMKPRHHPNLLEFEYRFRGVRKVDFGGIAYCVAVILILGCEELLSHLTLFGLGHLQRACAEKWISKKMKNRDGLKKL
jgi:hypothetical protein